MLQLSNTLLDVPVLSLRTGSPVATTIAPLINPNNLKIEGLFCIDRFSNEQLILLTQDIRERLPEGLVVNDHEVLTSPDELIKFKKLIDLSFEVVGKPVRTVSHDKVGKVNDYSYDSEAFYIQKLYLSQPLLKNLTGGHLVVDRNHINEITNRMIIIDDLLQPNELSVARS